MTDTLPAAVQDLLHRAGESVPAERLRMIEEAYVFAAESHDGQMRKSGEPYIIHPLDAALTVAELNLDGAAIAAALLHDVVEDCDVKPEEIARRFGDDVARLVEGVTKLNKLTCCARRAVLGRGRAGRQPAQDVPRHGGGHPRRHHQAGRPPA